MRECINDERGCIIGMREYVRGRVYENAKIRKKQKMKRKI